MQTRLLFAGLAALVGCSSNNGNDVTCGDGTALVGNQCVIGSGSGSGSGQDVTCGSGTVLDGDTCVPAPNDAGAPAIASISPTEAGVFGGGLFEITGTGFAGDNVTSVDVYFGDPSDSDCEAAIGAATATAITGEVPIFCGEFNPSVTVITNLGSASTPFHYDAIFAADGDGGTPFPHGFGLGSVYLIDPFSGQSFELGGISDAGGNSYGIDGMAFDATGTSLYAATTGDSPADNEAGVASSIVLQIDPLTGSATVIGDAIDAGSNNYIIADMKMSGGTLYGWAYVPAAALQGLVTIDTTSGLVTPVGGGMGSQTFDTGGLTFDDSGTLYVAANGAGSDSPDPFDTGATGELDTASVSTGALTAVATLDWSVPLLNELTGTDLTLGAPIDAMATFGSAMLAVVDDGGMSAILEEDDDGFPQVLDGETLAVIDPTGSPIVQALFELPAQTGFSSQIDAIAVVPAGNALPVRHRRFPRAAWKALKAAPNAPSLAARMQR